MTVKEGEREREREREREGEGERERGGKTRSSCFCIKCQKFIPGFIVSPGSKNFTCLIYKLNLKEIFFVID